MTKPKKTEENIQPSKHDELFTLVRTQNGTIAIVVGEFKAVPREFGSFKTADEYIATKPYKLIFNTFQILQNYTEKQKADAAKAEKNAADNK